MLNRFPHATENIRFDDNDVGCILYWCIEQTSRVGNNLPILYLSNLEKWRRFIKFDNGGQFTINLNIFNIEARNERVM